MKKANGDRDGAGRFRRGHRSPGPGNRRGIQLAEQRRRVAAHFTPEHVLEVLRALFHAATTRNAETGTADVGAGKVWLDHVIGRPRVQESPLPDLGLDLAGLDALGAAQTITEAALLHAARGTITREDAEAIVALADRVIRTREAIEFEARLRVLEGESAAGGRWG